MKSQTDGPLDEEELGRVKRRQGDNCSCLTSSRPGFAARLAEFSSVVRSIKASMKTPGNIFYTLHR